MSEQARETVTLPAVLSNTAQLLEVLAVKSAEIDEAMGDWLASGEGARPPVRLLQEVDLLRQSVDCLQILIANLARQTGEECTVAVDDIVEGIYLELVRSGCCPR